MMMEPVNERTKCSSEGRYLTITSMLVELGRIPHLIIRAPLMRPFLSFFFVHVLFPQESGWRSDGKLAGLNVFGNIVFAYMFFAMLAKICLMFSSWNAWYVVVTLASRHSTYCACRNL